MSIEAVVRSYLAPHYSERLIVSSNDQDERDTTGIRSLLATAKARFDGEDEPIRSGAFTYSLDSNSVARMDFVSPSSSYPTGKSGILFIATVVSTCLHMALLSFLFGAAPQATAGSAGQELDAIGIELVPASALEAMATDHASTAGGATAPVEVSPGTPAPVEPAAVAPQVMAPSTEPYKERPEALVKPDPSSTADAEIAAAETIQDEPKPSEEKPVVVTETNDHPGQDAKQRAPQEAIVSGGEAARGISERATDGTAGASAGDLARFAMEVRLALGRSRPRHDGESGRVQVSFGLTETGDLRFIDVVKSSGRDRLDDAVVSAVRGTKFPNPPIGASDAQRTYVVPFDFK